MRSTVPTHDQPLHCWYHLQKEGWAGPLSPGLGVHPLLLAICMQFCPSCIWPQGFGKGLATSARQDQWGEAFIQAAMGAPSCTLVEDIPVRTLGVPTLLSVSPHPCSVLKPSKLIGSLRWTVVESDLGLHWDLSAVRQTLFTSPQGRNFNNRHCLKNKQTNKMQGYGWNQTKVGAIFMSIIIYGLLLAVCGSSSFFSGDPG